MPSLSTIVTVSLNPAVDRVVAVENFTLGAHQKGRLLSRTPAGKAVNVSRALAALGVPSVATGFVGADTIEEYETFLGGGVIQTQFLSVAGRTRENLTLLDPATGVDTHIREDGFEVTAADLSRLEKKINLLARPGTVVIFSGSMPSGVAPEAFRNLVRIAQADDARVAVDTSGPPLAAVADLPLWLVKPNTEELADLLGHAVTGDDQIVAAGRALSKTIHTVIISCGAAGGYVFVDGAALLGQVDLGDRPVVSTVGCGDCLLAGFVAAHTRGRAVRDAYRRALAVATAAAVSAQPGAFDPPTADVLYAAASVEPVAGARP